MKKIRVVIFLLLFSCSCGSVQTVNGIRLKGTKNEVTANQATLAVCVFALGYTVTKNIIERK